MSFSNSERAVSEIVGVVIILGLTMTGIALIALVGVPSIIKLEDLANIRDIEQAYTMLDSHASRTLLGDAPNMVLNMNLKGGILNIEPNGTSRESYVRVDSNSFNLTIPMGKLRYAQGERTVAYEGGGVWSKYPSGSVMLSPPEFHYNGRTLTLPVIDLIGNTTTGGRGTAEIYLEKNTTRVLYPDAVNANMLNPVNGSSSGKVYVNITSEFYDAWAEYARSLIYTIVNTDPETQTAIIELTVVPNTLGDNTSITQPIDLMGLPDDGTPVERFGFKLYPAGNSFNWDIRAKSGNKELIFHVTGNANNAGDEVDINVGYKDETYNEPGETWAGDRKLIVQEENGNPYILLDLLNTSLNLTYDSETVGTQSSCSIPKIISGDFNTSGFSWGSGPFVPTTNKSLNDLTQHYIQLMAQEGIISFFQCSPSGNQGPDSNSTMIIDYTAAGAITYLHISQNEGEIKVVK